MKSTPSRMIAMCGTALALVLTSTSAAFATQTEGAIDSVESVMPGLLDGASSRSHAPLGATSAITADNGDLSVDIPVEPSQGITIDGHSAHPISIGLPFADGASDFEVSNGSIASSDNGNGSQTVALAREDNAVQVLSVIQDSDAPVKYAYPLDLPAGATLHKTGTTVEVRDGLGVPFGEFSEAWAFDSAGKEVPTRYEVSGDTLIQYVEHDTTFTYPVVADPTYNYYWSRAQVENAWNAINVADNTCRWVPLPGIAGSVCGMSPAVKDAITQAHYQKKRVKAVYTSCGFNYCSTYRYYVVK